MFFSWQFHFDKNAGAAVDRCILTSFGLRPKPASGIILFPFEKFPGGFVVFFALVFGEGGYISYVAFYGAFDGFRIVISLIFANSAGLTPPIFKPAVTRLSRRVSFSHSGRPLTSWRPGGKLLKKLCCVTRKGSSSNSMSQAWKRSSAKMKCSTGSFCILIFDIM